MEKYMNPFYKFSFILIIVTFFCDLGLNFLSRQSQSLVPRSIKSLKSYFDYYNNIALTGIYASITVLICYLITAAIVYLLFNLSVPNNTKQLFLFLFVAFFVGYIADIIIYKYKIFGTTLDLFYKEAGAGLYGAISFILAIVISYFIFGFRFSF